MSSDKHEDPLAILGVSKPAWLGNATVLVQEIVIRPIETANDPADTSAFLGTTVPAVLK